MTSINRAFTRRCGPHTRSPHQAGLRRWVFKCEIREAEGELVDGWQKTVPVSDLARVLAEAEDAVASRLPSRRRPRLDAYPAALACWLARTGYGALPSLSLGQTAALVFGLTEPDRVLRGDRLSTRSPAQKRVWDHTATADRLVDARRTKSVK